MLRQFTKQKPTKGNENDVEGPIINRGNKQFGPSGKNLNSPLQRPDSPALKLKPNNQKEIKSNKSDNQSNNFNLNTFVISPNEFAIELIRVI